MAADSDRLALRRTFLAHERTLMAWIRTSVSLISFGFTIYKFFQYLVETKIGTTTHALLSPRRFALCMIGVGVLTLAVATIDYRRTLKTFERENGEKYHSLTL